MRIRFFPDKRTGPSYIRNERATTAGAAAAAPVFLYIIYEDATMTFKFIIWRRRRRRRRVYTRRGVQSAVVTMTVYIGPQSSQFFIFYFSVVVRCWYIIYIECARGDETRTYSCCGFERKKWKNHFPRRKPSVRVLLLQSVVNLVVFFLSNIRVCVQQTAEQRCERERVYMYSTCMPRTRAQWTRWCVVFNENAVAGKFHVRVYTSDRRIRSRVRMNNRQ